MTDEKSIQEREDKLVNHLSRIIDNLNQHWHSIQLLLSHVSKPLRVDDRGLANCLYHLRENISSLTNTIAKFNHEQSRAELMFIGKRLSNIEEEIKKIKEGGIKKQVDLQIQVDGYEMIKKPLNHDKTAPIEKSCYEKVEEVLKTISDREAKVLVYRFGLLGKKRMSLRAIGESMKLSQERIRQIEAKGLRKLRHPSRIELVKQCDHKMLKKAVLGEDN